MGITELVEIMGLAQSSFLSDGGIHCGYHVHGVGCLCQTWLIICVSLSYHADVIPVKGHSGRL